MFSLTCACQRFNHVCTIVYPGLIWSYSYYNCINSSWDSNAFRITGLFWGDSTGDRLIPLPKDSNTGLWYFFADSLNNVLDSPSSFRPFETPWHSFGLNIFIYTQSGSSLHKLWYPCYLMSLYCVSREEFNIWLAILRVTISNEIQTLTPRNKSLLFLRVVIFNRLSSLTDKMADVLQIISSNAFWTERYIFFNIIGIFVEICFGGASLLPPLFMRWLGVKLAQEPLPEHIINACKGVFIHN